MNTKKEYSLKCAYESVPKGEVRRVRKRIQEILGGVNESNVYAYIRGDREPTYSQGLELESLFNEYGISINNTCEEVA